MADPIVGGDVPWTITPKAWPEDITEALARPDEKEENRIYRTPDGHHVKVKTWQVAAVQAGVANYFMSGSLCDAEGTALVDADGLPLIVGKGEGVGVTELWRSNPKTQAEQVEEARQNYVLLLERVAKSRAGAGPVGVAQGDLVAIRTQLAKTLRAPPGALPEAVAETRATTSPMPAFPDGETARAALRTFDREPGFDALPEDLRAALLETAMAFSAVDAVCQTAELIYARRGEVTGQLLALGAGLAAMAATLGWQGFGVEARGAKISAALRREAGEPHPIEGQAWPDPEADPEPVARFVPADPAAEI